MILEMSGKRAKHRMRPPERVHRLRKPTMKPLQGFADGRGGFLRRITRAPWMAPLKFIQRLEFAQRLLLNGRRRVVVVQKRFQLPLFAPEGPGRLGILEPQAALLQHRTRFRHERRSAGGARHLGCNRDGPVNRLGPQREIKRVLAIGLRSALTALIAVRPFPAIGATRSAYQAIGLRLFALDQ